jgi:hypothetical protein
MSTSGEADTINSVMADPAPILPSPLNGDITLLRGLRYTTDDGDTWHDHALVREWTGADEEYLSSIEGKTDLMYIEYMSALLQRAVLSIGEIDVRKHPSVLDKLILADRDLLFLAIVRSTYGKVRKLRVTCQECSTKNDVEIDLFEDFPIKQPDFDVRQPIEIETSKGIVKLRLPNGEDNIEASKKSKDNTAALNTYMLARCAVWENGDTPADPVEWARTLSMGDRKQLIRSLLDVEIGPKLGEVDTHCAECGAVLPIPLDWVSLLLG